MRQEKAGLFRSPTACGWLVIIGFGTLLLSFPLYVSVSLWYTETKGPFKNWTRVVDLEGDGDLDVIVSHTRWEEVDLSWAGIGRWINQGKGKFELVHEQGTNPFGGFAAATGDVDQDDDPDIFTQDFGIHLLVNQGSLQAGSPISTARAAGSTHHPPMTRAIGIWEGQLRRVI